MKDFPGPPREGSAYGPGAVSYTNIQDGDSRKDVRSPAKAAPLLAEGKVWHVSTNTVEKVCLDRGSLLRLYVRMRNLLSLCNVCWFKFPSFKYG